MLLLHLMTSRVCACSSSCVCVCVCVCLWCVCGGGGWLWRWGMVRQGWLCHGRSTAVPIGAASDCTERVCLCMFLLARARVLAYALCVPMRRSASCRQLAALCLHYCHYWH